LLKPGENAAGLSWLLN